jgi:hypothetical protein
VVPDHSNVTASPELHEVGMHTSAEQVQMELEHCAHVPLRQILCDSQWVGGVQDGEQVHVVPSGRHTLVSPDAHVF